MAKPATSQLVACAWLATIPGIESEMVDIELPQEIEAWAATGFVQVGGTFGGIGRPDVYIPHRRPVLEIFCWGTNPGTDRPNWGKAADLAELIIDAAYRNHNLNVPLELPRPGYRRARVTGVWPVNEPDSDIRDVTSYGKYTLDLEMHWIELDEEESP